MYSIRGKIVRVDIWDQDEDSRFKSTKFWNDMHGDLLVYVQPLAFLIYRYDITSKDSFKAITQTLEQSNSYEYEYS